MTRFEPPCGPVIGWRDGDVVRATGIPYATARRFAPPGPEPDWAEPFEATEWAPACPQVPVPMLDAVLGSDFSHIPQTERCQNLSITLPGDLAEGESLPVMVWVHGGSYTSGAGDVPVMDPRPLVVEQRIIVVAVTYRLGIFGYFGAGEGRPANLGLLDQLAAFRWVQRNIAAFGGDPRRVTGAGQSAGADAIAHVMATEGAASLMARAIIQSAPLGISRGRERMASAMADAARDLTENTPTDEVVAAETAVARAGAGFGLASAMPFGTQYGHAPLPAESAVDDAWRAVAPQIDVLIGHTREEARLFVPRVPQLAGVLRVPVLGRAARAALVGFLTRSVYARSDAAFARRHARAGGRAHEYEISWAAPGNPYGSAHTIDLPLLFGDEQTWMRAPLVAGTTWAALESSGRAVRAVWGAFVRGETLSDRGEVPGTLRYRRVT